MKIFLFQGQTGIGNAVFTSDEEQVIAFASNSSQFAQIWNIKDQMIVLQGSQEVGLRVRTNEDALLWARDTRDITSATSFGTFDVFTLFALPGGVTSANFNPQGDRVVTTGADGTVRLWNLNGSQLESFRIPRAQENRIAARNASFSQNGELLLITSEDGIVRLMNLEEYAVTRTVGTLRDLPINIAQFCPDNQHFVTALLDGRIIVWNTEDFLYETEREGVRPDFFLEGHQGNINSISFNSDENYLLSTSRDGSIRIWDIQGNNASFDFQLSQGYSVNATFSPTNSRRFVTIYPDDTARVFDLLGEEAKEAAILHHNETVISAIFSPNGQYVVTASIDTTAKVWNLEGNLQEPLVLQHEAPVDETKFSPNSQTILTVSGNTIHLWNLDGQKLAVYEHLSKINDVNFSPNGENIVTAFEDGTARLWRVENLDQLLAHGCNWLRDYLTNNPGVSDSDRALCGISTDRSN